MLSLGMVLGLGTVGTLAAWSDTSTATSGTFTTGAIDLRINDSQGRPSPYAFTALNAGALLPGASTSAVVTVQNWENMSLTYTVKVHGSGSLAPSLVVSVFEKGTPTARGDSVTCTGGTLVGTVNVTPSAQVVSTNARPLGTTATSRDDALCVQATLPRSASNSVQGAGSTLIMTFEGTSA